MEFFITIDVTSSGFRFACFLIPSTDSLSSREVIGFHSLSCTIHKNLALIIKKFIHNNIIFSQHYANVMR